MGPIAKSGCFLRIPANVVGVDHVSHSSKNPGLQCVISPDHKQRYKSSLWLLCTPNQCSTASASVALLCFLLFVHQWVRCQLDSLL